MSQGIFDALEDEHPRPFADHQPVALLVERSGLTSCRERTKLRESHLGVERIGARDASAQHRVSPSGAQLVDREFEGVK